MKRCKRCEWGYIPGYGWFVEWRCDNHACPGCGDDPHPCPEWGGCSRPDPRTGWCECERGWVGNLGPRQLIHKGRKP